MKLCFEQNWSIAKDQKNHLSVAHLSIDSIWLLPIA